MGFEIQIGTKFTCLALKQVGISTIGLPAQINLGEGRWILSEVPFDPGMPWREWLGPLELGKWFKADAFLIALRASRYPGVVDDESEAIRDRVIELFYGLLLNGIGYTESALLLSGANLSGEIQVRSSGELEAHYRNPNSWWASLTEPAAHEASQLAQTLERVRHDAFKSRRLTRGFQTWIKGMQEFNGEDRLHQFVRSLEALVRPSRGKTEKQFVHRCQLFIGKNLANSDLLRELYVLRSCAEHMNPFEDAIGGASKEEREARGTRRAFEAEILASQAYLRIFSNSNLLEIFGTNDSLAQFWAMKDHERESAWGPKINISSHLSRRYSDQITYY
jgi:hypothetical protein